MSYSSRTTLGGNCFRFVDAWRHLKGSRLFHSPVLFHISTHWWPEAIRLAYIGLRLELLVWTEIRAFPQAYMVGSSRTTLGGNCLFFSFCGRLETPEREPIISQPGIIPHLYTLGLKLFDWHMVSFWNMFFLKWDPRFSSSFHGGLKQDHFGRQLFFFFVLWTLRDTWEGAYYFTARYHSTSLRTVGLKLFDWHRASFWTTCLNWHQHFPQAYETTPCMKCYFFCT